MKTKEWIEILQKLDPEESICIHYWQVGDVIGYAKEMEEEITSHEAQQILDEIEDNIDSEMGVSWSTIGIGIDDFIRNRDKK